MNFVAHAVLCAAHHGDVDAVLGSVAPDLVPRAGLSFADPPAPRVAAGLAHHAAVDEVFHRHPWFTLHRTTLFADLQTAGVGRGPSRVIAHVGLELLIDGELIATGGAPGFADVWERLRCPDIVTTTLVDEEQRDRWLSFLDLFTSRVEPARYRDPDYVTSRLAGLLSTRSRFSLGHDEHRTVADALSTTADAVAAFTAGLHTTFAALSPTPAVTT